MADDSPKPPDTPTPPPTAAADTPAGPAVATTSDTSAATGQPAAPAASSAAPSAPPKAAAPPVASAASATAPNAAPAPAKPAAPHAPTAAPPTGPTDPPPPADAVVPAFIAALQSAVPGSVAQISLYLGDWTVIVPVTHVLDAARHLRDAPDAAFDFCSDVTATDWPPRAEGRFDVVYCLYSTRHRRRVRVKVKVGERQAIPSVAAIWPAANWLEREVYDMFGVNFTGHPDRRRILMPDDWQGFPQRKDYPLEGPGELLMENPLDWLRLRQSREQADIE
jgi:NADH-quinone oxidoreductase subunit C